MCKFRPKDKISAQELTTRLKVKGMLECYRMQNPVDWSSKKIGRECLVK